MRIHSEGKKYFTKKASGDWKQFPDMISAHQFYVNEKLAIDNIKWNAKRKHKGYYKDDDGYRVMLWIEGRLQYYGTYPTIKDAKKKIKEVKHGKKTNS